MTKGKIIKVDFTADRNPKVLVKIIEEGVTVLNAYVNREKNKGVVPMGGENCKICSAVNFPVSYEAVLANYEGLEDCLQGLNNSPLALNLRKEYVKLKNLCEELHDKEERGLIPKLN